MTAPYTAAELAAILARPASFVCTKCGYCGPTAEHYRPNAGSSAPPLCAYTAGDIYATERRLVAELTRAREALKAHGRHGSDCDLYMSFGKDPGHCRCGLSQALRAALGEEPADGDNHR